MRMLVKLFVFPLVVVILLGVGGHYIAANLLKTKLSEIAEDATGTSVSVRDLNLNAFTGYLQLQDVRIGNPPGYKSETAFEIETLAVHIQPKSLLSDRIRISSVEIVRPFVKYEMKGARTNNIREIQKNIRHYTAARKSDSPQEKKTVKIDTLRIRNGKIRIGATLLAGQGVTIPMPETTITDIDTAKDEDGGPVAALPLILARILRIILGTAGQIVSGAGQGAGNAGAAAVDTAKGLLEGLKNLAP